MRLQAFVFALSRRRLLEIEREGEVSSKEPVFLKSNRLRNSCHIATTLKMRIKDDLGDREYASGLQGIKDFLQRCVLVRNFPEDCHCESPIEVIAFQFSLADARLNKTDVRELGVFGFFFGAPKHARLNVDGEHLAIGNALCQWDADSSGATADIQHRHVRFKFQVFNDRGGSTRSSKRIVEFDKPAQPDRTRQRPTSGSQTPADSNEQEHSNEAQENTNLSHNRRWGEHTALVAAAAGGLPPDTRRRDNIVLRDSAATGRDTWVPHLRIWETLLSRFSFMNAQLVTIRVHDNRSPAVGHIKRLNSERHLMTPEMFNRSVEVIYFQHEVRTVA